MIKNIEILAALRSASETEQITPSSTSSARGPGSHHGRDLPNKPPARNPKRQKLGPETTDGAADAPSTTSSTTATANVQVMAPNVVIPARAKGASAGPVRSGSVPTAAAAAREVKAEPVVKIEEGSEGSKGPAGERAGKFFVGAEVAYKQAKPREDGSQWIQCNITSITEVGGKMKYVCDLLPLGVLMTF